MVRGPLTARLRNWRVSDEILGILRVFLELGRVVKVEMKFLS